jgi:hypothetical protein
VKVKEENMKDRGRERKGRQGKRKDYMDWGPSLCPFLLNK